MKEAQQVLGIGAAGVCAEQHTHHQVTLPVLLLLVLLMRVAL
jgi:hypothetical protein